MKTKRKLETVARANACLRQKLRRLDIQKKKLEERLKTANDKDGSDPEQLLTIRKTKGGQGKRLTLSGTIALAIRRNFGNCATADIGAMLLQDISRYTVTRSESRAGTALIASSRIFFHSMYQELTSRTQGTFKLAIHSFIQDATNSGILKGSKLAALILRSAYLREDVSSDPENTGADTRGVLPPDWEFDIDTYFEKLVRVADVLPVDASDSATTAAQTLKHLEGLGCWTWKDIANHPPLQQMQSDLTAVFFSCAKFSHENPPFFDRLNCLCVLIRSNGST